MSGNHPSKTWWHLGESYSLQDLEGKMSLGIRIFLGVANFPDCNGCDMSTEDSMRKIESLEMIKSDKLGFQKFRRLDTTPAAVMDCKMITITSPWPDLWDFNLGDLAQDGPTFSVG